VLLPLQSGPHRHLVVIAGKGGTIYLIDRDHMGHYQPNDDSQAVQTIPSAGGGVFGSMAYWNHNLYVLSNSSNDALRQFFVHEGKLMLKAASGSRFPATTATPTVSANGARDGAAYGLEPPYLELELTTPRHGDRPFHICHIDDTELDIELVCSHTGQNLGDYLRNRRPCRKSISAKKLQTSLLPNFLSSAA